MRMPLLVVVPLRAALVVLFGILVVFETLSLPGQFRYMAQENPQDAHLRWPLTIVAIFFVVCLQVVVVATWRLLTFVKNDRIFSEDSLRWVDAIVYTIAAGLVVFLGLFLWVGFQADDPGVPLLMFLLLTIGSVVWLLLIVMRALLRQAISLRSDLEAVI